MPRKATTSRTGESPIDTHAIAAAAATADAATATGAPAQDAALTVDASRADSATDAIGAMAETGSAVTPAAAHAAAPRSRTSWLDPVGQPAPAKPPTKLAQVAEALRSPAGATLAQLGALTGWQPHSVRAALSGLRKGGHVLATSKGEDGATVYRIAAPATAAGAAPEEPDTRRAEARADLTGASS